MRWCEASVTEAILFYVFAAGVLFAGAQVILWRNPIYGAISLVGSFFFLAGIYVLLASAESSYATGQVYGAVGGRGGP